MTVKRMDNVGIVVYRLCYIRGPEGILIGLAQQLGQQTSRENPMEHTGKR
jgi:hypothetical protein